MTHDELVIRRGNANGQTGSLPPAKAIKVNESKMNGELLELIAANEEFYGDGTNRTPSWSALRAVVEIVEAFEGIGVIANEEFDQGVRSVCRVIIQAIEKELK